MAAEEPPKSLNQLAQDFYKSGLDLRSAVEDYSSKRYGGKDPKRLFPDKTEADVVAGLKGEVKPVLVAHRAALKALVDRLKAEVDATIT